MAKGHFILLAFLTILQVTCYGIVDKELLQEFKDAIKKEDATRIEESAGLFEGDIELDKGTKRALTGGQLTDRDAVINPIYHWYRGVVYFKLHKSLDSGTIRQIHKAMDHIKRHTCVRFEEARYLSYYHHVVAFFKGHGCFSRVGRDPSRRWQRISIGRGCTRLGTVVHEIMHTLGFFHEQSRPDRDEYIKIKWKNIIKKHGHNFKKYPRYLGTSLGKQYDYDSVMHYSKFAFTKNGNPTIVTIKKKNVHGIRIGQRFGLSRLDAYEINKLYQCHDHLLLHDLLSPYYCEALNRRRGYCTNSHFSKRMSHLCARTCSLTGQSRHDFFFLGKRGKN